MSDINQTTSEHDDHSHVFMTAEEHMKAHELGLPHSHGHGEGHGHVHANQKAVINRLARCIGHLEAIKRMVEDGRDCSEVLVQLAAVKSAINNTGKVVLKDHIEHCIVDAVASGDQKTIDDLNDAIDKFLK